MEKYKKIPVKTTYMEMTEEPTIKLEEKKWATLTHYDEPNLNFYREIYKKVGEKWGWAGRLVLNDEELKKIINEEDNQFYYLSDKENLVGFFELKKDSSDSVELVYLGLVPEYIGKGFGKYLLNIAILKAWQLEPKRIWLHTCEFDHKNAISVYEKAGFKKYKETVKNDYYPTEFLKSN